MKLFMFLISALILSGCDSPQRNKVDGTPGVAQKSSATYQFASQSLSARAEWLEGPFGNVTLPSTLIVTLYDANQRLTSLGQGQELGFFAVMPSMGHPLDQPGFFEEVSPGVYINRSITFNMNGDWQMQLWIQNAEGEIEDQVQWLEIF